MALVAMVATTFMSATASAQKPVASGEQINVLTGDLTQEFPASTPFYIQHGFVSFPQEEPSKGQVLFLLDVDGVSQGRGEPVTTAGRTDDPVTAVNRLWRYEFPEGMTGTHEFTGHWFVPCKQADLGPCVKPHALTEALARTVTVCFSDCAIESHLITGTVTSSTNQHLYKYYMFANAETGGYDDADADFDGNYALDVPSGEYVIQYWTGDTFLGYYSSGGLVLTVDEATLVVVTDSDVAVNPVEFP